MKYILQIGALVSLLAQTPEAAKAQANGSVVLQPHVIEGGGVAVASVGGRFRLDATVGQTEAAPILRSSDGRFAIEPGFWTGITVMQTPEAPVLKIRPALGGKVVMSWPVTADGFVLEENPSPGSLRWARSQTAVIDTRTEHTVTVPAVGAIKCYRLRKE